MQSNKANPTVNIDLNSILLSHKNILMKYYTWSYGLFFSVVKVSLYWAFEIQVIDGMLRLGSFVAI